MGFEGPIPGDNTHPEMLEWAAGRSNSSISICKLDKGQKVAHCPGLGTHLKQCRGHWGSREWQGTGLLGIHPPTDLRDHKSFGIHHWSDFRFVRVGQTLHPIPTMTTLRWTNLVCFMTVFQVPQQKSKPAPHLNHGLYLHWPTAEPQEGPPRTFNSREAPHFATKRREGNW